jgi:hypothetical protein
LANVKDPAFEDLFFPAVEKWRYARKKGGGEKRQEEKKEEDSTIVRA